MKNKIFAFTMAEVLSVVAMLGVVAVLTVPSIIHTHKNTEHVTKLKKAYSTYDAAMRQIVAENRISTNTKLSSTLSSSSCSVLSDYFRMTSGGGCTFETPDGVWWSFKNDGSALVGFSESMTAPTSKTDTKPVLLFKTKFENGGLHINDKTALGEDQNDRLKSVLFNKTKMKLRY